VLAASILSNSQFSDRVPKRIKDLLSAESGCNDGISFPFLFIGIAILQNQTFKGVMVQWLGETIGWQCILGTAIGLGIGWTANKILRFSEQRELIDPPGFVVFYLLAALLCVGIGSTINTDDFLVAFGAGYGFARDGWFAEKTKGTRLPNIIDLLLNSSMFVYLGTIVPWYAFHPQPIAEWITPGRVVIFVILVLLLRRIPIVLLLYRWIPDIRTFREALFCGHFGPMGLGGVFLAIEARAQLETGTSIPLKHPPPYEAPYTNREKAVETVWPLVIAIVFASTMVHGLSVFVMSAYSHLTRPKNERAKFFAAETDPLYGMEHEDGYEESLLSEEFEPYSDEA
jgi:sodium/hydrogen antiporter